MQAKLTQLYQEAQKYRGLPAKTQVPMGQLDKEGLKKKMLEIFAEEMPEKVMSPARTRLESFQADSRRHESGQILSRIADQPDRRLL